MAREMFRIRSIFLKVRKLTPRKIYSKLVFSLVTMPLNSLLVQQKKLVYTLVSKYPRIVSAIMGTPLCDEPIYFHWLLQHYPRRQSLGKLRAEALRLPLKPTISIILPVYNPPKDFVQRAINSVINQVYPFWELCIADDASDQVHVRKILESYAAKDSRIKVIFRQQNGHISQSSNSALDISTGEFFALLDHDDTLAPHALLEVAKLINQHPDLDLVYSDEDKMDEQNFIRYPYFKPDWSADTLLTKMYTCHLSVYRKALVNDVGRFRTGYEGAQDYDLALRVTERSDKIHHIPTILYHWRMHPGSIAMGLGREVKPYAYPAAQKSVTSALQRRGEPASVTEVTGLLGFWDVRYQIRRLGKISIIITAMAIENSLADCLNSIFRCNYNDFEVILVTAPECNMPTFLIKWLRDKAEQILLLQRQARQTSAEMKNFGASRAQGLYLLFLDQCAEPVGADWMHSLVEQTQRPVIGVVGGLMMTPQNIVYHAGVTIGIQGAFGYSHRGDSAANPGYVGALQTTTNYSALTGEVLMCRRELFQEMQGFDQDLTDDFADIDLCLRIQKHGFRNVYIPHAKFIYSGPWRLLPSISNLPSGDKRKQFAVKWAECIQRDPCYNPNLTKAFEDFRFSSSP